MPAVLPFVPELPMPKRSHQRNRRESYPFHLSSFFLGSSHGANAAGTAFYHLWPRVENCRKPSFQAFATSRTLDPKPIDATVHGVT